MESSWDSDRDPLIIPVACFVVVGTDGWWKDGKGRNPFEGLSMHANVTFNC